MTNLYCKPIFFREIFIFANFLGLKKKSQNKVAAKILTYNDTILGNKRSQKFYKIFHVHMSHTAQKYFDFMSGRAKGLKESICSIFYISDSFN